MNTGTFSNDMATFVAKDVKSPARTESMSRTNYLQQLCILILYWIGRVVPHEKN